MPPFQLYFRVTRKQHFKEGMGDSGPEKKGHGLIMKQQRTLLFGGMGIGTYRTLKWIINRFRMILIITTILFILIILELTCIGRILRMILSRTCKLIRKCRKGVKQSSDSDLYSMRPSPERAGVVKPYKATYV